MELEPHGRLIGAIFEFEYELACRFKFYTPATKGSIKKGVMRGAGAFKKAWCVGLEHSKRRGAWGWSIQKGVVRGAGAFKKAWCVAL